MLADLYNPFNVQLLNKIRIAHAKYISDDSSDDSLVDLCSIFKIPIDSTRVNDYSILEYNFNIQDSYLKIYDSQNGITYKSSFSNNSEILGRVYPDDSTRMNFVTVVASDSSSNHEFMYYVEKDIPDMERLTIINDGEEICLLRSMPGVINKFQVSDGVELDVSYSLTNEDGKDYDLFYSIYKTGYKFKKNYESFEQLSVSNNLFNHDFDIPVRFSLAIDGNISTGMKFMNNNYAIYGACFEKIDDNVLKEMLCWDCDYIVNYNGYDTSQNVVSLYSGNYYDYDNQSCLFNNLEIIKEDDNIRISYKICDTNRFDEVNGRLVNETILNRELNVPIVSEGIVTIEEIDSIIDALNSELGDIGFIKHVISDIELFKEKLIVKKGNVPEILRPLSAKSLFNKSFEEIRSMILSNKSYYFEMIKDDFEIISNRKDKSMKKKMDIES